MVLETRLLLWMRMSRTRKRRGSRDGRGEEGGKEEEQDEQDEQEEQHEEQDEQEEQHEEQEEHHGEGFPISPKGDNLDPTNLLEGMETADLPFATGCTFTIILREFLVSRVNAQTVPAVSSFLVMLTREADDEMIFPIIL
ncbi:NAD-dependent protein deacetylase HST1-like isoform X2 [Hibiscus syriacus]|uniref:NAD-dependent protein deacetylase HST1-like isoform X2 n=1 Tax=Hibiscus syriacus TaxID=106335 RepID=UPI00192204A3|nr:NAD-dependent protein deacetylase HST1-like isoform X2 [Hibiscus syriacus]